MNDRELIISSLNVIAASYERVAGEIRRIVRESRQTAKGSGCDIRVHIGIDAITN